MISAKNVQMLWMFIRGYCVHCFPQKANKSIDTTRLRLNPTTLHPENTQNYISLRKGYNKVKSPRLNWIGWKTSFICTSRNHCEITFHNSMPFLGCLPPLPQHREIVLWRKNSKNPYISTGRREQYESWNWLLATSCLTTVEMTEYCLCLYIVQIEGKQFRIDDSPNMTNTPSKQCPGKWNICLEALNKITVSAGACQCPSFAPQ